MTRRKKQHYHQLPVLLAQYAKDRTLDFGLYSEFHMRIMDGGYITLDVWTTGRYFVLQTDYAELTDKNIVERGGEKGSLPSMDKTKLYDWLDDLFFAADKDVSND